MKAVEYWIAEKMKYTLEKIIMESTKKKKRVNEQVIKMKSYVPSKQYDEIKEISAHDNNNARAYAFRYLSATCWDK